jgi:prepilin-type N-terminal cleavage/methylation domain-containing protein
MTMKFMKVKIRRRCARRGFTLIELLVVIVCVAILATILLPALAGTRPRSQQMLCSNNIKQLTLAEIMYCSENGGNSIPDGGHTLYDPPGFSITGGWFINLYSYFNGATNLMICPAAIQPAIAFNNYIGNAITPWCRTDYMGNNAPYFGDYAINGWLYTSTSSPINGAGDGIGETLPGGGLGSSGYYLSGNQVKYPSHTPVFSDGVWVDCWPLETDSPCHNTQGTAGFGSPNEGGPGKEMARACLARHACNPFAQNTWTSPTQMPVGAENVGLFDGHAEPSTLPNLWNYNWHNNWKPNLVKIAAPY